jgi:hypothetical protein
MTFFSRLFEKKTPAMVEQTEVIQDTMMTTIPQVDKSIFIDDRDLMALFPTERVPQKVAPRRILDDLKSKDYFGMGKRDGYDEHDLGIMEMHVDIITSDFREAFHGAIEEIEESIAKLGMYLTSELQEAMPEQHEQIHTKHDLLIKQRRELTLQLDLAVAGEGYIEKYVRYYRAGFRKGQSLFIEEKLLVPTPKF